MSENLIVVDYEAGNLRSVQTALDHLGYRFRISARPEEVDQATELTKQVSGAYRPPGQ